MEKKKKEKRSHLSYSFYLVDLDWTTGRSRQEAYQLKRSHLTLHINLIASLSPVAEVGLVLSQSRHSTGDDV